MLEEVGNAILSLHTVEYDSASDETWKTNGRCAECRKPWPCDTYLIVMA